MQCDVQPAVLFAAAALRARRLEIVDRHTYRHALMAGVAARTICESAAATEAVAHQLRINRCGDEEAGGGHLRTRFESLQVTARVGCGQVEMQCGKLNVLEQAHVNRSSSKRQAVTGA